MRPESLDFFRSIVNVPSPSGSEEHAAELFREYCRSFAASVTTNVHGNVIASVGTDPTMKIMLSGHMDEIGFIVHYVDDDGMLFFSPVGGHDSVVPVGQRVWVHGRERVAGVMGRKAVHLLEEDERKKKPELKDLWVDIGAASRDEALGVVELGSMITFQHEYQELLSGRVTARGFDNKMGAFVVAEALRLVCEAGGPRPGVGVYAVGTVQEEIGLRGARTAAYELGAQTGIAVDVNHAGDYPGINKSRRSKIDLGKGATVSRGPNTNPVVFQTLRAAAEEGSIPYQVDVQPGGTSTDANVMQINMAGMATGLLGVPLRYMHTPCEVLSLGDVEACASLMAAYCLRVSADSDFTPRIGAGPLV